MADNPHKAKSFEFVVVDGPNIILGRTAIKHFWPKLYNGFSEAAAKTHNAAALLNCGSKQIINNLVASKVISQSQSSKEVVASQPL